MKFNQLLFVLILLIVSSCNKNLQKKYNLFENDNSEYILKNNISEITEFKIGLDTSGISLWKRIKSIKIFNNKGLLIKTINPGYITAPFPKSSSEGFSIDEINYYLSMNETNIPNGKVDTTYFDYDENQNLLSTKNEFLITYKYDTNNNEIEKCVSSEYNETVCNFKRYVYDENQRIKYCIDSSGVRASRDGRKYNLPTKKSIFKYDKNGKVIFDGEYNRVFNENGMLISISKFDSDNKSIINKYEFTYDTYNRKVSETFTQQVSSSWDPKTNITSNRKTSSIRKYFYYDAKGLLKQEKTLDNKDKLISLVNYEYKFNN